MQLREVYALISPRLALVEEQLRQNLESPVPLIAEIGRYIQQSGGKRIRPALHLLLARLCGYQGERDILYAAVFESIHTATLIHDDIIDQAEIRRGRGSVNSRWGNDLSVLFGDYLYLKALKWALEDSTLRTLNILADLTTEMVEGELIQSSLNGHLEVSEEQYLDVVVRKTANLFAACGQIAAIISGRPPEQEEALRRYGLNLGIAFQLTDDLLDLESEAEIIGKPVVSDVVDGKLTLPLIRLLESCDEGTREKVRTIVREKRVDKASREELRASLAAAGVLESTRRSVEQFAGDARRQLDLFPEDTPVRRALLAIPGLIASRST